MTGEAISHQFARPDRSDNSAEFQEKALNWFRKALTGKSITIDRIDTPNSTGMSAETFFFTLAIDGILKRYVLRREPVKNAVFVDLDTSHQASAIGALHMARTAPVPAIIGVEQDASVLGGPFFVMEHVAGRTPPDAPIYTSAGWVCELAPAEREQLWWSGIKAMAGVAALDWQNSGLSCMLRGAPGQTELEWEFEYYLRLHRDHCDGVQLRFITNAEHWLRAHLPRQGASVLSWGDARLGNMIFQGLDCAAIIDWEMSMISVAERDIAWWLYIDSYFHEGMGKKRAAGWPSHAETQTHYESLIGTTLVDMTFYKAFAAFRSAVILARFTALGLAPDMSVESFPPGRLFWSFAQME